ncbi:hypothetical protein H4582DRAFT_1250111 [Lactarius indigo]|nr:hypothetical protein H4582DRAFT_1250111 [Lactarius indigo]
MRPLPLSPSPADAPALRASSYIFFFFFFFFGSASSYMSALINPHRRRIDTPCSNSTRSPPLQPIPTILLTLSENLTRSYASALAFHASPDIAKWWAARPARLAVCARSCCRNTACVVMSTTRVERWIIDVPPACLRSRLWRCIRSEESALSIMRLAGWPA